MKSKKKISICLPTYNGQEGIKKHLQIFFSSKKNKLYEFVITDNCSTDHTFKIVKKYKKIHNNLKYFRNSKNYGYNYNYFKSIKNCNGEFVMLLSDDTIPSKNLYDEILLIIYQLRIEINYYQTHLLNTIQPLNSIFIV